VNDPDKIMFTWGLIFGVVLKNGYKTSNAQNVTNFLLVLYKLDLLRTIGELKGYKRGH
jgi:hypothetical protein